MAAQLDEVADCNIRSIYVVNVYVTNIIRSERTTANAHWHFCVHQTADDLLISMVSGLDNNTVYQAAVTDTWKYFFFVFFGFDKKECQGVIVLVTGLGDSFCEVRVIGFGKEGTDTIWQNQTDCPGTLRSQGSSGRMRKKPRLPNSLKDPFADILANVRVIVHDPRDG